MAARPKARALWFSFVVPIAGARLAMRSSRLRHLSSHRGSKVLCADDISRILVMTTASVPWLTGTSVNAAMRAAELARMGHDVVLFLPWASREDQVHIFPTPFVSPAEQATFVLRWLEDRRVETGERLCIAFYDSHYHAPHHSLYPMGETLELVQDHRLVRYGPFGNECSSSVWKPDLIILEEPEHLNWYAYRRDSGWRALCPVIGIVHTNYAGYARTERAFRGLLGELVHPAVGRYKQFMALTMARWMCQAHCHKIIKLSGTIPKLSARETTCNVHGVRPDFLKLAPLSKSPYLKASATKGAYFIGKIMWQKGLDRLLSLLQFARRRYTIRAPIDLVGSGPDLDAVRRAFDHALLPARFLGRKDHIECAASYRVLVNPSVTEVLCTTVAEALAMGKWVIIARHVSNEFFYQFPTCLAFSNSRQFALCLNKALTTEPPPLPRHLRSALSWTAATERFWSQLPDNDGTTFTQRLAAFLHVSLGTGLKGDILRTVGGAGPLLGFQAAYVRNNKIPKSQHAADAPRNPEPTSTAAVSSAEVIHPASNIEARLDEKNRDELDHLADKKDEAPHANTTSSLHAAEA